MGRPDDRRLRAQGLSRRSSTTTSIPGRASTAPRWSAGCRSESERRSPTPGLLAERAHAKGLAVGQKNTADITKRQSRDVGFDFAIAEECARYDECGRYRHVHGDRVIAIEYRRGDFRKACRTIGDAVSVVLRDRQVSVPGSPRYAYDAC